MSKPYFLRVISICLDVHHSGSIPKPFWRRSLSQLQAHSSGEELLEESTPATPEAPHLSVKTRVCPKHAGGAARNLFGAWETRTKDPSHWLARCKAFLPWR